LEKRLKWELQMLARHVPEGWKNGLFAGLPQGGTHGRTGEQRCK